MKLKLGAEASRLAVPELFKKFTDVTVDTTMPPDRAEFYTDKGDLITAGTVTKEGFQPDKKDKNPYMKGVQGQKKDVNPRKTQG